MDGTLDLRTLEDWTALAARSAASGFFPCRRPEEALVILLTGRELGIAPMAALRGIYVVSGRPVLSADLIVAAVRRSGLCETWRTVESTPERCVIETRRRGEEHATTKTWTKADAQRAGLVGKGTWSAYPAQMLRHRCAADLAREVYPDVVLGLYDPDELPARAEPDELPARAEPEAVAAEVARAVLEPRVTEPPPEWLARAVLEPRVTEPPPEWLADVRDEIAELGGTLTVDQAAAVACDAEDAHAAALRDPDARTALDRALQAKLPDGTPTAAYVRACAAERHCRDYARATSLDEVEAITAEVAGLRLPKRGCPERERLGAALRSARARLAPTPEPDGDGPRGGGGDVGGGVDGAPDAPRDAARGRGRAPQAARRVPARGRLLAARGRRSQPHRGAAGARGQRPAELPAELRRGHRPR